MCTVRFADEELPVPAFVELTFEVVLVYCPATTPVTVTLNWHWLLGLRVAPDREIPVGAVSVTVPPQIVALALGTVKPVGRVSVKPTPVSATALDAGLVTVKLSPVVAPREMLDGLKEVASFGGDTITARLADEVLPGPASVELTFEVVLMYCPATAPVTVTVNWHWLLGLMVAPDI